MRISGRHDRLVTILKKVVTQDPIYGTEIIDWQPLATDWAEVQDVLPSRAERLVEGINLARRPCRVRLRWRDDIDSSMRLSIDGRTLEIIAGPAELGRRERVEFMAEELSTSGG